MFPLKAAGEAWFFISITISVAIITVISIDIGFTCPPSSARHDAATWGRLLAEGEGRLGFMTVAHPDLLDGVQVQCYCVCTYGCISHQVDAVADFIYHIRLFRSVVNHE